MKIPYFIIIMFLCPLALVGQEINLLPEPWKVEKKEGVFTLSVSTSIQYPSELKECVEIFNKHLSERYGFSLKKGSRRNGIRLIVDKNMKRETYNLLVETNGVMIRGSESGVFYGLQTLQQLISETENKLLIPEVKIEDRPRFKYRGVLIDVARYYQTPEFLKKYIDVMAHYKLNVLHLHLTEDAGWRIEIKKYPELTRKGAWRPSTQVGQTPTEQDNLPHGGFYTQKEIRDIIQYANERQITIIPEIDMPGHMMAALSVFPELSCTGGPFSIPLEWGVKEHILCAGNEKVFDFIKDVLTEVIELFPSEYIHLGGDEAPKKQWKVCTKCQNRIKEEHLKDEHELQSYFIQRVETFVNSKGKRIIGWDEILEGGLAPDATIMSWRGEKGGIAAANLGHDVIMAPTDYFYLDYYQSDDRANEPSSAHWGATVDLEKTYSFNPLPSKISADKQKHVIGVQACVWGEKVQLERDVEYMSFPRALALAEIAWTPQEKRNYADFCQRVVACLSYLDWKEVTFRIPEALSDVEINAGKAIISLQSSVKGADIYYTTDGTSPWTYGKLFTSPVTLPLTFNGIDFRYTIVLPSGRSSAVYKLQRK